MFARASSSSFGPQCSLREKDQAPVGIGLISRVTGEMSSPTLVPRSCFISGTTKANVCTDLLDFQTLSFPQLLLSQTRFSCGAPAEAKENGVYLWRRLFTDAVFTSPACGSNWRPVWLFLVGFLGDYVEARTWRRHQPETWLPLLIFAKPESSAAWQLAPSDTEEGTTRSFRLSFCLPDIYSNDFFFSYFLCYFSQGT